MEKMSNVVRRFALNASGATIVEYAVALIVVVLAGAAVFALGDNIAVIVDQSAGAF